MTSNRMKWSNHLFAKLPENVLEKWEIGAQLVHIKAGDVLFDVGSEISHVYFPFTSIISIKHILMEGETIEVAMIGIEGIAGIFSVLGITKSPHRAVAICSGYAYKLHSSLLKFELEKSINVMRPILQFMHVLNTQTSLISACNRHHTVNQQLTRWLLLYLDRSKSNTLHCTQESISNMLGVRRERITKSLKKLKDCGAIKHTRGIITITNRSQLESICCECYSNIKKEYDTLSNQYTEII